MDYIKKTILLTNDKKEICVLNLVKTQSGIFANFKNYVNYMEDLTLGITVNGVKVYKQNVICNKSKGYDFKLTKDFDLNGKIGCVLFKESKGSLSPVVWGLNGDIVTPKQIQSKVIKQEKITSENSKDLEKNITMQEVTQAEEKTVNKAEIEENNENKIKVGVRDSDNIQTFSNSENLFETDDSEIENIINQNIESEVTDFFDMISDQIDELFAKYPSEKNLERVVPNSKWVSVDFENNGKTYVVGLVYENEILKYVAYGVPTDNLENSTTDLENYGQWIPIDPKNPEGYGYWVIFQNAVTGESVKI